LRFEKVQSYEGHGEKRCPDYPEYGKKF